MNIAMHATGAVGTQGRGIGVYTKLLTDALKNLKKSDINVELVDTHKTSSSELRERFDLIHYLSFDFFFPTLPFSSALPRVVTIHDTIPLLYPKHYPSGVKGALNLWRQKRALNNVEAIITDSETSKKDIVRFLHVPSSKIHTVYLASTLTSKHKVNNSQVTKKYGLPKDYVIYIGDVNWNKNILALAEACDSLKVHLIIVGKKAASTDFDKNHIENQPLRILHERFGDSQYIHRIGFVPDDELPSVLSQATVLCQPSYYEGFGLSVLDAMEARVPTLCARTQALVELYEQGSTFFDPHSVTSLTKELSSVLKDKKLRMDLIKNGEKVAKRFSWEKTALETSTVYRTILQ